MTTVSGAIATTVVPLGIQRRTWPGIIRLDDLKKRKKKRKMYSSLVPLDAQSVAEASENMGSGKWKLDGKEGVWRRVLNRYNVFFPDDGSAPTGLPEKAKKGKTGKAAKGAKSAKAVKSGKAAKAAGGGEPDTSAATANAKRISNWNSDAIKSLDDRLKKLSDTLAANPDADPKAVKAVEDMMDAIRAGKSGDPKAAEMFAKADEALADSAGGKPGTFGKLVGSEAEKSAKSAKSAKASSKSMLEKLAKRAKASKSKSSKAKKAKVLRGPKKKSGDDIPGAKSGGSYPGAGKSKKSKKAK